MYKKITSLVLITIFVSCKKMDTNDPDKNEKDKIKTARWLQGQWETKSEDGTLTETWKKINDSTYNGHSFFLKGKDTVHYETIVLQQIGEQLSYRDKRKPTCLYKHKTRLPTKNQLYPSFKRQPSC
jgi:hypothetical protein